MALKINLISDALKDLYNLAYYYHPEHKETLARMITDYESISIELLSTVEQLDPGLRPLDPFQYVKQYCIFDGFSKTKKSDIRNLMRHFGFRDYELTRWLRRYYNVRHNKDLYIGIRLL